MLSHLVINEVALLALGSQDFRVDHGLSVELNEIDGGKGDRAASGQLRGDGFHVAVQASTLDGSWPAEFYSGTVTDGNGSCARVTRAEASGGIRACS